MFFDKGLLVLALVLSAVGVLALLVDGICLACSRSIWVFSIETEKRGLALGKYLYATKFLRAARLRLPYTLGSVMKARQSCLMTIDCFPSSRIQAVCGE